MAFEDSSVRARGADATADAGTSATGPESRYLGEGFRHEPDFRDGAPAPGAAPAPAGPNSDNENTLTLNRKVPPTPNLDYVFDDPTEGEPGRDRLLIHGVWELLLAAAVVGVGYLLFQERSTVFGGESLRTLLLAATVIGALAAALAIGVWMSTQDPLAAPDGYNPDRHATYWFAGFCAVSVVGGLLGMVPAVRRALGRFRPVADPADRRGFVAALITLAATAGSAALAGLAGVLIASGQVGSGQAASSQGVAGIGDGLVLTGLGVGAALLGGTSAFGRRGGVFGTALAVALLTVGPEYVAETGRDWAPAAFAAAAIGTGLLVTRMVERFGRPSRDGDGDDYGDDWSPTRPNSTTQGWTVPREPSWQTTASSPGTAGLWGADDAWNR
jgi:hypothetical protein